MIARRRIDALEQRAQARDRQRDREPLVLLLPVFGPEDPLRIPGGELKCPTVTVRQVQVEFP